MLAFIPVSLLFHLLLLPIPIEGIDVVKENAAYNTVAGILDNSVDTTIDPCEDFYSYACNGFIQDHSDLEEWTRFDEIADETEERTETILDDIGTRLSINAAMPPELDRVPQPIINTVYGMYHKCNSKHFLNTWADEVFDVFTDVFERPWPQLFQPDQTRTCDIQHFSKFLAQSHKLNMLYYNADHKSAPAIFTPLVQTSSHSLPVHLLRMEVQVDRKFNKPPERKFELFKPILIDYITDLRQQPWNDARIDREIMQIAKFEDALLHTVLSEQPAKKTDLSYSQFRAMVSDAFDFDTYIGELFPHGVKQKLLNADVEPIRTSEPHYFEGMGSVFHDYPCDVWYNYVYYKIIEGSHYIKSQRKSHGCIDSLANSPLKVGLATLYLHTHHKQQYSWNSVRDMAVAIREEMQQMIVDAKWMTPDTRWSGREKERKMGMVTAASSLFYNTRNLNDFHRVIIIDYDPAKNYYQNRRLLATWYMELMMKRIGSSDPICANDIWYERYALDIEAMYQHHTNQFILTPGMMRKPIYDIEFPTFYNFGILGTIIGHEITHGFDNKGRQFDEYGRRRDWSDHVTDDGFERKADCFIQQYGNQRVDALPGRIYMNGTKTLAENIADNAGIRSSFNAYRKWKYAQDEKNIKVPRPKFQLESLNSKTTEQLFFISSAQQLCKFINEKHQRRRLRWDIHSPNKYRVNIPLQNFETFSNVFGCKLGTNMNPNTKKCRIW